MRNASMLLLCFMMMVQAKGQVDAVQHTTSATIADSLKKDAVAVYRLDEAQLDIRSAAAYTLTVHQVVTVLNEEGAHYLQHKLHFDKQYKVEDVEIKVYNDLGLLTKKYGRKDFEVEAAYDGISLMTDDKLMRLYTPAPGYPCTVDIQYTISTSGYIELPNWYINTSAAATEVFRYTVSVPEEINIRHRTLNIKLDPKTETNGKVKKYTWEARNIAVKRVEADGYEPGHYLPQVEVAPNQFVYDGYAGSFRTWSDFGKWNYSLYDDRQPLNEHRVAEIKALVQDVPTPEEKIAVLYQYLQRNMRYVSIQLGIGGFKPFPVRFVDDKRYGDCKALTNYMRQLLAIAGIKSYPALINAGSNKTAVDPAFPTSPFNHVILCVPAAKDTTWLECTSNKNKAGFLGNFTENKRALLLTEEGGKLVNTPVSNYKNNRHFSSHQITINEDGGAQVSARINSAGDAAMPLLYLEQLNDDQQKEMLTRYMGYKAPEALVLKPAEAPGTAWLQMDMSYSKLFQFKAGKKFFFPLSLGRLTTESPKAANRKSVFLFDHPFEKGDTTVFRLPQNFVVENVPEKKELNTAYSTYRRSFVYNAAAHTLTCTSYMQLKNHVIPPADYLQMVAFFKSVSDLELENIILVQQ